ncbi:Epithelial membrane protein 1, partial [Galemys pyrenaicus]
ERHSEDRSAGAFACHSCCELVAGAPSAGPQDGCPFTLRTPAAEVLPTAVSAELVLAQGVAAARLCREEDKRTTEASLLAGMSPGGLSGCDRGVGRPGLCSGARSTPSRTRGVKGKREQGRERTALAPSPRKAKMLVLLASIFVVHTATAIMLFVSAIANVWVVTNYDNSSMGLWKQCIGGSCNMTLPYADDGAIKAVQAFMILAIIFCVISLVIFVFQLFTLEKGNRFFISGATMLVCCEYLGLPQTWPGRLECGWAAGPLLVVLCLLARELLGLGGLTCSRAGLCVLVGASIYTHHYANKTMLANKHHGYCFILTWICFCFSLIVGIVYLVLRKK